MTSVSNAEPTCSLTHLPLVCIQHPCFPGGLLYFEHNIKLLQLNNNHSKTHEYTYLIFLCDSWSHAFQNRDSHKTVNPSCLQFHITVHALLLPGGHCSTIIIIISTTIIIIITHSPVFVMRLCITPRERGGRLMSPRESQTHGGPRSSTQNPPTPPHPTCIAGPYY